MAYIGELISIGVAFSWMIASLWSEIGSKRLGAKVMNVWRMGISVLMYAVLCWIFLGKPFPVYAGVSTWLWLALSGFIGFFLGDLCLLGSYVMIGARLGQLFQTLAPPFSALFAWMLLGQTLSWKSILAMAITLCGIGITVLGGGRQGRISLRIPVKGALMGVGAALGQGLGLVISGIGLNHYLADVPAVSLAEVEDFIPFSANMIRCIAGFIACTILVMALKPVPGVGALLHDAKSAGAIIVVCIAGPVMGVGFSLMALRYTSTGIASTLQALTPILLIIPSHFMFGEKITARAVIGAIVAVAGVSLFFLL